LDGPAASLWDAEAALARPDPFARRVAAPGPGVAAGEVEADPAAIGRFRTAMDDDLHTQTAVALVFDLVREANAALDAGDAAAAGPPAAAVVEITGALGLELQSAEVEVPGEVTALARERDEARPAPACARADALRDR